MRATIAEQVCTLRRRAGLTQRDLASKAGLSFRTVQEIEGGSGSIGTLTRVLHVLGYDLSGLPDGTSPRRHLSSVPTAKIVLRQPVKIDPSQYARPTVAAPNTVLPRPNFDIRPATRADILPLIEAHHGYKSLGKMLTYAFAVFENEKPVAAFAWVPPPPGAALAVCPECPQGVLSLSRMVAVPKHERRLKHISKPLRFQMRHLIDRTRWPVLVTYSDEGQGHNGFTYQCSGWHPTWRAERDTAENNKERVSTYSNGQRSNHAKSGFTTLQRWEQWTCARSEASDWLERHGWQRQAIVGKRWTSGSEAYRYVRAASPDPTWTAP